MLLVYFSMMCGAAAATLSATAPNSSAVDERKLCETREMSEKQHRKWQTKWKKSFEWEENDGRFGSLLCARCLFAFLFLLSMDFVLIFLLRIFRLVAVRRFNVVHENRENKVNCRHSVRERCHSSPD